MGGDQALMRDQQGLGPSLVVMTDHPLARLLLYTIALEGSAPSLRLTATHQLTRISARPAEHFTGLVADRSTGVVVASLYTGLLVVAEVGAGAVGDAAAASGQGQSAERRASEAQGKGKRKASLNVGAQIAGSAIAEEVEGEVESIPVFKEVYEIKWVSSKPLGWECADALMQHPGTQSPLFGILAIPLSQATIFCCWRSSLDAPSAINVHRRRYRALFAQQRSDAAVPLPHPQIHDPPPPAAAIPYEKGLRGPRSAGRPAREPALPRPLGETARRSARWSSGDR